LGVHTSGAETLSETLEKLRKDRRVEAIVLRINSPGGSSTASDALWRSVQLASKEKPVIVSMGGTAASGGYYLASAATRVFANPSSVTGSIGVFYGKGDVSELLGKIGVDVETYKTHPNADAESWFRPFTDGERQVMTKQVETLYDLFVARVAEGRKLTKEQVDAVGKGRVWTGRQAVKEKLADEVGGLRQAIEYARREAHLSDTAPIIELPVPETSLWMQAAGFTRAEERTVASIPLPIRQVLRAVAPVVIHPANKAQMRLELTVDALD
jgi:protease-4